jgi:hypothetical protein
VVGKASPVRCFHEHRHRKGHADRLPHSCRRQRGLSGASAFAL